MDVLNTIQNITIVIFMVCSLLEVGLWQTMTATGPLGEPLILSGGKA